MFTVTKVELGKRPVGREITIEFPYSERISIITRMVSPCDCSLPYDYKKERKMVVKYTPKPVPEHLRLEGKRSYQVNKTFEIHYVTIDNTQEIASVSFTGTILG